MELNSIYVSSPIPENEYPDNRLYKPIISIDEKLVSVTELNQKLIEYEPIYYKNNINGAIDECYLREKVAELLIKAAELLPQNHKLKIYDAWRPALVQESLFWEHYKTIKVMYKRDRLSEDQLKMITTAFISFPSYNPMSPFVHATGGAVDLTILDPEGKELKMGTDFDDFTRRANTAFYENTDDEVIRNNRRLLYNIMISAGFTNHPSEWWHYDYGDRFWAFYKDTNSFYPGIYKL